MTFVCRRLAQALLAPGADRQIARRLQKSVLDGAGSRTDLILDVGSGSESRICRLDFRTLAVDVSFPRVAAAAASGASLPRRAAPLFSVRLRGRMLSARDAAMMALLRQFDTADGASLNSTILMRQLDSFAVSPAETVT